MLRFSFQNSKINKLALHLALSRKDVVSFDLPAGWTCPAADKCKAFANRKTGKITDGKNMVFRCYAASTEAYSPAARAMRWNNFDQLKNLDVVEMVNLILSSLPENVKIVRIHSSGDFFKEDYFQAWVRVAEIKKSVVFFGYTKVLPYVKANKPDNFHLVYSYGGKMDEKLGDEPTCYVLNKEQAELFSWKIACQDNPIDDFYHIINGNSFALLIHGGQPKGVK